MNREIKFRAWDGKRMEYNPLLRAGSENNVECDEGVLMQYTGLKDKNGKEIYEGDLIGEIEFVVPVEFHDGSFTVGNSQSAWEWLCARSRKGLDTEVIGNIYENPDLLSVSPDK